MHGDFRVSEVIDKAGNIGAGLCDINRWKAVCENGSNNHSSDHARVPCHQLGYSNGKSLRSLSTDRLHGLPGERGKPGIPPPPPEEIINSSCMKPLMMKAYLILKLK